jgi:hypothetical protein
LTVRLAMLTAMATSSGDGFLKKLSCRANATLHVRARRKMARRPEPSKSKVVVIDVHEHNYFQMRLSSKDSLSQIAF